MTPITAECKRMNLCVDCDDKECWHSGDKVADCPIWTPGRAPECKNATSCDDCQWLEWYIGEERHQMNKNKKESVNK